MLYLKIVDNHAVDFSDFSYERHWQNRNDWKSFAVVEGYACDLNRLGRGTFIAVDNGTSVSPRYDVIKLMEVGELVSYGFNGDYYPCGHITKISPNFKKITTSTGDIFYRHKLTGSWFKDGTWALTRGVHNDRNPSF